MPITNTEQEINHRLLHLFPVASVKDHFDKTGRQNEVIHDVLAENDNATIKNFARGNFGYLKQHVYVFTVRRPFNLATFNPADLPYPIGVERQEEIEGEVAIYSLPLIKYNGLYMPAAGEYSTFEMHFPQPVKVVFRGRKMFIYAAIVERDLKAYLPVDQKPITKKKDVSDDFVSEILSYFEEEYRPRPMDLNAGVKALCETDTLNPFDSSFAGAASISSEKMKEKKLMKIELPDRYSELMLAPIEHCKLEYLLEGEDFCSHFATNPTYGTLSFALFPRNPHQVKNVVDEIVRNC